MTTRKRRPFFSQRIEKIRSLRFDKKASDLTRSATAEGANFVEGRVKPRPIDSEGRETN
jgi:hypothetical protein